MNAAGTFLAPIHPWNVPLWTSLPALDRLAAALLLTGPAGVGKREFGQGLAAALLCAAPREDRSACGACASCRLLLAGSHPDLRVLDIDAAEEAEAAAEEGSGKKDKAASRWIKIEAVRALRDFLSFTSHLAGRKVVLIQQADRLHPNAANALLKTLEEPPAGTHFILLSSRPNRLPVTVRSRCVRIPFSIPSAGSAARWLAGEGCAHAEAALAYAGGAPLTARNWTADEQWSRRRRLVDSVLSDPDFDAVAAADGIDAESLGDLLQGLQRWSYDLLLARATGQVRYHPDCARILHSFASRASPHALLSLQRELAGAMRTLDHPLNPRLVAERYLIRYKIAVKET